tara:strand:+ start:15 stop:317 length:303 start_codon:yes stop_codon:yes gene_type:complete
MNKKENIDFFEELYEVIKKRDKKNDNKSYTKKLLKSGKILISQKIIEESTELVVDYIGGTKKRTIEEASDLIYHLLVLLYSKKISIKEIKKELNKRKNVR